MASRNRTPTIRRAPLEIDVHQVRKDNGLILLFLVIGIGCLMGNLRIAGLPLGPTIGLLMVGLFFGHHGLVLPDAVGYLVGRKLLKMNPFVLLGSLTGAMTSTPALAMVTDAAKSGVPAIGYAGTYTFANVILTFAGTFLVTL